MGSKYGKRKIMGVMPPCVGACTTTTLGTPVCGGCARTAAEVVGWIKMDLGKKIAVIERLDAEGELNEQNRPRYPWLGNSN